MALYVNFITTELLSDINYVENVSESYKDIRNKIGIIKEDDPLWLKKSKSIYKFNTILNTSHNMSDENIKDNLYDGIFLESHPNGFIQTTYKEGSFISSNIIDTTNCDLF